MITVWSRVTDILIIMAAYEEYSMKAFYGKIYHWDHELLNVVNGRSSN